MGSPGKQRNFDGCLGEFLPFSRQLISSPLTPLHLALNSMKMDYSLKSLEIASLCFLAIFLCSSAIQHNPPKNCSNRWAQQHVFKLFSYGNDVFRVNCFEVTLCQTDLSRFCWSFTNLYDSEKGGNQSLTSYYYVWYQSYPEIMKNCFVIAEMEFWTCFGYGVVHLLMTYLGSGSKKQSN